MPIAAARESAKLGRVSLMPSADARIALGDSGLAVAPLGWGMWRLADQQGESVRSRVEAALEAGCTLFDTADIYGYHRGRGFGIAESLLGGLLREAPQLRERMVLATKAGIAPPAPYDSSRQYLIAACDASLRRLNVECIDLFQIHRPDLLTHPAEVARALDELRRAGKIRAAGVSNYSAAQFEALAHHLPFALASVQNELSPLAIEALTDGTLDAAMKHGAAVIAWSPLAQGRLMPGGLADSARTERVIAALESIAQRAGVSRAAVAYAWVMAHPARPIPLIGSQNPANIRAARAAYGVDLTREEWYRVLVAARGAPMP
ncbi:MAG TPA: aldo/keto reductase [Steroidobacteraceae bacterium]|nr:aldo/keto reductase [Steroidobacteraceae bacterium]